MAAVEDDAQVLAITELGYGKRTDIEEYRLQSRGGKGIRAMKLTERTGPLACQLLVHEDEDLMLITSEGVIIRMPVSGISTFSRTTQGVRLMRVPENSRIVCVARSEADEEDAEQDLPNADNPQAEISGSDGVPAGAVARADGDNAEPDALDRLLDDLEENPEPEDNDDI